MAKNYEAICESLRLTGEQKLLKLSNAFQEHQQWLKQAFEDARAQLGAQKAVPQVAKPGRGRGASDKENVPAPKRSSRKRGTPATVLESIGEEAGPEEDINSKPEAPAQAKTGLQTDLEANAEEGAPEGTGAQGKPPLPGKARRDRAAKKEEAEEGTAQDQAAAGQASTQQDGAAPDTADVAAQPQTVHPVRRTTRRTAKSGTEAMQPAEPARQTRRAAAVRAAAATAADADGWDSAAETKAVTLTEDKAPVAADTAPSDQADEQPAAERGDRKPLTEDDAQEEEEQEPPQASKARRSKGSSGQQISGKQPAAGDAGAGADQEHQPSPGQARAQRAGRRAANSIAATPAQRKEPSASALRTTRRMAAAERAAVAKPDVQAHRLELSDEESDADMDKDDADMDEDAAAEDTASPAADSRNDKEAQKAEQAEATPQAVEDTPVPKRAAATAARPKRAAAAAAQRAIAATAVKRQRGRRISGASFASVPGTTRRTRQAAAAEEEEAGAAPAGAAVKPAGFSDDEAATSAEAAELQPAPQGDTLAEDRDVIGAGQAGSARRPLHVLRGSVGVAEHPQAAEEPALAPMTAAGEPGTAAPTSDNSQPAAAETGGVDSAHPAAAGEGAAAKLDQAQATAGTEAGTDQEVEKDIEADFEEAQDVFETPSQHPRMMTPGTSFGTARQQPSAYKTGQEYLTGVQPSTGKPVFIRPELKDGPLARAAAAAAAQHPAVSGGIPSAQPQDIDRAAQAPELSNSAQQSGAVQRLRQQYEETILEEPATLTENASQGEQRRSLPAEQVPEADASSPESAKDEEGGPSDAGEAAPAAHKGVGGMGANLVSTVRSFLPFVSKTGDVPPPPAAGKKPVKVKALEAAEAARRKEAQRATQRAVQRQQVEAQKAERAKRAQDAKAAQGDREEEARRQAQEALTKKEEEAAARRHAKEEAEKKEREERQKRQEELRQKRKQAEQERAAAEERSRKAANEEEERKRKAAKQQELEAKRPRLHGPTWQAKPAPAAVSAPVQAAGPAEKLVGADLPGPLQHASAARLVAAESAADLASRPATAMPIQGVVKPSTPMAEIAKAGAADSARAGPQAFSAAAGSGGAPQGRSDSEQFQSYELSPYKSGSDSEDSEEDAEREKKPVPKWARGLALTQALVAQMAVDPDEIFKLHQKTCPLNEVFSDKSASDRHPRKDLNRRTSSGNWIEDRVTWKEELNYKKAMGYL